MCRPLPHKHVQNEEYAAQVRRLNKDVRMEGKELRRRSFAGRRMLFVFGGVEIEDLASLSRARVDRA